MFDPCTDTLTQSGHIFWTEFELSKQPMDVEGRNTLFQQHHLQVKATFHLSMVRYALQLSIITSPPIYFPTSSLLTLKANLRVMLSEDSTRLIRKLSRGKLPRTVSSFSSARRRHWNSETIPTSGSSGGKLCPYSEAEDSGTCWALNLNRRKLRNHCLWGRRLSDNTNTPRTPRTEKE